MFGFRTIRYTDLIDVLFRQQAIRHNLNPEYFHVQQLDGENRFHLNKQNFCTLFLFQFSNTIQKSSEYIKLIGFDFFHFDFLLLNIFTSIIGGISNYAHNEIVPQTFAEVGSNE